MARVASLLAVAAVAAVAVAAALDAVGGGEEAPAALPAELAGELLYSDAACRRHAVRLPDLATRAFRTVGCGVFTRRDNLGVRDGAVAWFAYPHPLGSTTVLTARDVERAYGPGARVGHVAWLGRSRFVAAVAPQEVVTIWERGRLVREVGPHPGVRNVRASARGRFFAVLARDGVAVYDRDGTALALPDGTAVAWSEDERYAAIAAPESVIFVAAEGGPPLGRIPVAAHDLAWLRP